MATSIISMKRRRQKLHHNRLFRVSISSDTMKSDFICQPRVQLDKLPAVSSQRMTSKDAESAAREQTDSVAFCVSENAKPSAKSQNSAILTGSSEKLRGGVFMDSKPNCEEPTLSKEECQDMRRLREFLLLNLDLIQQQEDLINMKDQQLRQLTEDKESLRCRLERMERRMLLLRQNGERNSTGRGELALHRSPSPSRTAAPPAAAATAPPAQANRGIKRKHSLDPTSLAKKFAALSQNHFSRGDRSRHNGAVSTQNTTHAAAARSNRTRNLHDEDESDSNSSHTSSRHSFKRENHVTQLKFGGAGDKNNTASNEEVTVSSASKNTKGKVGGARGGKARSNLSQQQKKSDRQRRRIPKDDEIMRTDVMYYVANTTPIVPMDISPRKPEKKDDVYVPGFRIRPVPRGYTMEGTENLNDEIYLKRHSKPENEEKRRKRWDLQSMREQKEQEKLKQSRSYRDMNGGGEEEEEDFDSFLPDPDKVEFIEVCDEIPVSAFGHPLPIVNDEEFSLPWFDLERHEPTEKPRSRHRRR